MSKFVAKGAIIEEPKTPIANIPQKASQNGPKKSNLAPGLTTLSFFAPRSLKAVIKAVVASLGQYRTMREFYIACIENGINDKNSITSDKFGSNVPSYVRELVIDYLTNNTLESLIADKDRCILNSQVRKELIVEMDKAVATKPEYKRHTRVFLITEIYKELDRIVK